MWHPPRSIRPLAAASMTLLAGACIPMSLAQPSVISREPPEYVLDRALIAFGQYAIPVDHSTMPDRVESGKFEVQNNWGGAPVEMRVDCGMEAGGEPVARGAVIELQIRVRARRVGEDTRADLTSYGRTMDEPDGKSRPCRLKREFAEELFAAIAGAQSARRNWPPGRPGEERPPPGR